MTKYDAIKVLKDHKICFEHDFGWNKAVLDALDIAIKELDTDVAPVRHGKWIRKRTVEHEGEWYCSICGKDMLYTWGPGCGLADYCPHCGARMDSEQNG